MCINILLTVGTFFFQANADTEATSLYVGKCILTIFRLEKSIIIYTRIVLHCFKLDEQLLWKSLPFTSSCNHIYFWFISILNVKTTFPLFREALESLPESWLVFWLALDAVVCLSVVLLPEPHKWRPDSTKAIHQFYILSICLHYDHYPFHLIS